MTKSRWSAHYKNNHPCHADQNMQTYNNSINIYRQYNLKQRSSFVMNTGACIAMFPCLPKDWMFWMSCCSLVTLCLSFYLDLFAFSLIDMSFWKKKNLKSIFQTYNIKDFSILNQKLIIFHKIKIMWGWRFIYSTTIFFFAIVLSCLVLTSLGQRLPSESLIKKPWLLQRQDRDRDKQS